MHWFDLPAVLGRELARFANVLWIRLWWARLAVGAKLWELRRGDAALGVGTDGAA